LRYSDAVIEEVRSRNDIVDVVSSYISLKKSGTSYKCNCPFHNEKTPSFTVSRERQTFKCFGCGVGGSVITFVMKYENFSFVEAVKVLAQRAGMQLPEAEMTESEKKALDRKTKMKEACKLAAAYYHYMLTKTPEGQIGLRYYREKREFSEKTITDFGLGYASANTEQFYKFMKGKGYSDDILQDVGLIVFDEKRGARGIFWNRVMVPILDINGKCIGFGGRVLGDGTPKYMNTKETDIFDKSHNLFAMNLARRSKRRGVILCEGYMDVISQHQAGFDNAIASLGTAFTYGQANLIKRYTKEVFLAYDSDGAGVSAALKAIGILRNLDMQSRVISLEPYKDPDEFLNAEGPEKYQERIEQAIPGRMFEIKQLAVKTNMNDPEEKTTFINKVGQSLAGIEDIAERMTYIETVSRQYSLDHETLKAVVTRYGMMGVDQKEHSYGDSYRDGNADREEGRQDSNGSAGFQEGKEGVRYDRASESTKTKKREDPTEEAGKYLLTWMINKPGLFVILKNQITEKDFQGATIQMVASKIFAQYREKGIVEPASIINLFEDLEEQQLVADIMSTEIDFEVNRSEAEEIISDLVRRLKMAEINRLLKEGGTSGIQLARKKNELRNLRIRLDENYV